MATETHGSTPRPMPRAALRARLDGLAAVLENLAEPADRGLTDDLWVSQGTLTYLADTVRDLAERCAGRRDAEEG